MEAAPRDLIFRAEEPGEETRVSAIVRSAHNHEKAPRLLQALRISPAWRGLSFVGVLDDIIVAHAAFTRGWLNAPTELIEVLILSPMSVAPEWQRQGIGSALLVHCLKALATREEPLVFLEGNPRFYSRFGFRSASAAGFIAPSPRIPDFAFQFFPFSRCAPMMTGALVYPDVFWEMDAVGLRD